MRANGSGNGYVARVIDAELRDALRGLPAIAIEGAKGVGKTSSALQVAATTIHVDDPLQRATLQADRRTALGSAARPLLLDEWQADPELWNVVRHAVDDGAPPGSFILTGSADVRDARIHSGAGRIDRLRMRPLSFAERGVAEPTLSLAQLIDGSAGPKPPTGSSTVTLRDYAREILNSGMPGLRRLPSRVRDRALQSYVDNVIEHGVPRLGPVIRRPASLRLWLRAYAAAISSTATYERIADLVDEAERPSRSTIVDYRDALTELWLLDELPAWSAVGASVGRIARAPKHELLDPGLAAALLGAKEGTLLTPDRANLGESLAQHMGDGPLLGRLFESLVTLSVRVYAQASDLEVSHLRLRGGEHEVDLIVEAPDGRVIALEVKLGALPDDRDVRHLQWLATRLGDRIVERIVVTTGPVAFRRQDGVLVVPLALLGP